MGACAKSIARCQIVRRARQGAVYVFVGKVIRFGAYRLNRQNNAPRGDDGFAPNVR